MSPSTAWLKQASPLTTRLSRLAPLTMADRAALLAAEQDQRRSPPRRDFVEEGEAIRSGRAMLGGWACRQRVLPDGRRQILGVLLPGDLISHSQERQPVAPATILAITEVFTCPLPVAEPGSMLAECYARSAAIEEACHFAHITRLGRLDAYERLADWLLEVYDRLALAGLVMGDRLPMPLTQEMLADTLGLTSVHVNRTLQAMRRDGVLLARGGMVTLPDRAGLARLVGYTGHRVGLG